MCAAGGKKTSSCSYLLCVLITSCLCLVINQLSFSSFVRNMTPLYTENILLSFGATTRLFDIVR